MTMRKIINYAFLQSAGTFIYISAVAWLLFNGKPLFGEFEGFGAPMAMLLLFVLSATLTGALVLGRPIHLYLSGAKKESFKLLAATVTFLFLFTLLVFSVQVLI